MRNYDLDGKLERARAKISAMLGVPLLFTSFCSVCFLPDTHDTHKLKESSEGAVYRWGHDTFEKYQNANIIVE